MNRLHGNIFMSLLLPIIIFTCCETGEAQTEEKRENEELTEAIMRSDTVTIRKLVRKRVNLRDSFAPHLNYFIAIELNDSYGLSLLLSTVSSDFSFREETPLIRAVKKTKPLSTGSR
jgi:uncharacterized membrane protein YvbJ